MTDCTCPTPPGFVPCNVHFEPVGPRELPMGTVLYHPSMILRDEFWGIRCKRCGRALDKADEALCSECEKVLVKDSQRQQSWQDKIDPKTKAYVPGRTF